MFSWITWTELGAICPAKTNTSATYGWMMEIIFPWSYWDPVLVTKYVCPTMHKCTNPIEISLVDAAPGPNVLEVELLKIWVFEQK